MESNWITFARMEFGSITEMVGNRPADRITSCSCSSDVFQLAVGDVENASDARGSMMQTRVVEFLLARNAPGKKEMAYQPSG